MNDKRKQFYQTGLSMPDNFFGKEVLVAIDTRNIIPLILELNMLCHKVSDF